MRDVSSRGFYAKAIPARSLEARLPVVGQAGFFVCGAGMRPFVTRFLPGVFGEKTS